jgi:hypothetical protein
MLLGPNAPGMLDGNGGIDQNAIEIEDDGLAAYVCHSFPSFRDLHPASKQRFPAGVAREQCSYSSFSLISLVFFPVALSMTSPMSCATTGANWCMC